MGIRLSDGMYSLVCVTCECSFLSNRRGIKNCSDECKRAHRAQREEATRRAKGITPPPRIPESICAFCGDLYKPKAGNRTTYCSRDCTFRHKAERRLTKELIDREVKGIKQLKLNAAAAKKRKDRDELLSRVNRCTAGCGRITHIGKHPKRCDTCINERRREYTSIARKQGKIPCGSCRARAKHYGVRYEKVKPIEIAMKYGMRCALCKVSTPWSRRGTQHNNSPEIDHITPISKGGDHIDDNLQLLCRKCNATKSNTNQIGQHVLDI